MRPISNKDVSAPASLSNALPHLHRSFITLWIKDFHRLIPISDPHFEYFSVSHTRRWSCWHSSQSRVVSPCNIVSCRRLCHSCSTNSLLFFAPSTIESFVVFYLPSNWNLGERERRRRLGQRISTEQKINKFGLPRVYTTFVVCFIGHFPWGLIWSSGDRSLPAPSPLLSWNIEL